jgi:RNA polymerase sigma-70 factor (ECF subfamily)
MGVMRNRMRQWYRTNRRRRESPTRDVPETAAFDRVEDDVTARLELDRVTRALSRLPEKMTAVVIYRIYEEHSSAETATRLGMTEGAVRVLLHRALARLREDLREERT